nr:ATP synthase subunit C lysine N-methyltransferase isoform X4 [Caretta caretta]
MRAARYTLSMSKVLQGESHTQAILHMNLDNDNARKRNWGMLVPGIVGGTLVIAAAKEGFKAVGYELNPWLVWYSRYRAWREGMHHNAKFYISDLWKVSFSQYTNVVVFGVPQMMPQLEKKLEEELVHNARVVACRFPFPHWMPDHTTGEGIDVVWAYDSKAFKGNLKTC